MRRKMTWYGGGGGCGGEPEVEVEVEVQVQVGHAGADDVEADDGKAEADMTWRPTWMPRAGAEPAYGCLMKECAILSRAHRFI